MANIIDYDVLTWVPGNTATQEIARLRVVYKHSRDVDLRKLILIKVDGLKARIARGLDE